MKTLVSIIIVVCISMTLTVQAGNYSKQPVENSIVLPAVLPPSMNILSIKADIDNNRRGYFMTGSFTVLRTPRGRDGDVARTVDASFRNSPILSLGNYIQANVRARRNDNNSINEFRIYVHQSRGSQGTIDKRNIKVNWKTGSIEVVDKLANVSVIYQEDSILVIGTMQKDGYTIGVSLAISKETRV